MTERIFNFSAGPAVLPVPVLEEAQRDMLSLPGVGMSVMEISHRSKTFDEIIGRAESGLRELLGIPDNYHVLFLQGGASLQFSMVPMNFLPADGSADYVITGSWGKKALKEAKAVGAVNVAATMADGGFTRVPAQEEMNLNPHAAYVHITTNETIEGVEWKTEPEVGDVPLVADASSDILSHRIPVEKYGMIYAGAQKNMGPSGVTLVIIRDDLLQRIPDGLHTMLDYRTHVENKSLYNTPNTWGIYILSLVCKWVKDKGGLAAMEQENEREGAAALRRDRCNRFLSRSRRCRLPLDDERHFSFAVRRAGEEVPSEATAQGLDGLKGHRSVGGIRASIYNAFPRAGVEALVSFMRDFERKNG